jgi:predicted nucleic acid-binding protein
VIVIADTSVILNLCCVQQQELLPALFQQVLIPSAVRLEFERAAGVYPRFTGLTLPTWIREQSPQTIPETLRLALHLDAGEIAAIALALETAADAVLIDETEGRRAARQLGVATIGVAGILVRARKSGLLTAIGPVFDQLEQKANFWLAPEIRAEALRAADERR